jgi:hypothetical protein
MTRAVAGNFYVSTRRKLAESELELQHVRRLLDEHQAECDRMIPVLTAAPDDSVTCRRIRALADRTGELTEQFRQASERFQKLSARFKFADEQVRATGVDLREYRLAMVPVVALEDQAAAGWRELGPQGVPCA